MTARTLVAAPCTIDGGPEPRTIHHRILNNVENPYHLLPLNSYLLFLISKFLIIKEILRAVVDMGHTVVELSELA